MKLKVLAILLLIFSVCFIQITAQEKNKKESAAAVLEKIFKDSGIEVAESKFTELISIDKDTYTFNEQEFLTLGNSLRSTGRVKAAISVLKMTTLLFPQSSNAWFNLGQIYVRNVDREKAIESYKKALELDPEHGMAREEMAWIDFRIDDARLETREIERFEPGVNTGLKGPYLGQKPPGKKPVVFAPGIVSIYGGNENTITFSPDGKEIYFGREGGISICELTEQGWTAPTKTSIKGYEMYISPSTGKMYYTGGGIWEMEKTPDGWSKPRKLVDMGMFATLTQEEILYTTVFSKGAKIGRYMKVNGKYENYEILGDQFNLSTFNAHPCVSPDDSFLVFDSNKSGGRGYTNLYISFRENDGTWSKAVYLGDEINTPGTNNCSSLSPDGKFFFYTSHNDIYWVSAEILKDFRTGKAVIDLSLFQESSDLIPGSCTIFSASFGSTVLYGNNEDYRIPDTYYWAEPSGEKTYGGVFFGFDNFSPQGGINEKGLAFDYNALPEASLEPHPELPAKGDIMRKIYQTCATVEEAIALAKKYNWGSSLRWQVLLADATGDAVVFSAGPDGEIAFTRKPKGDGYLVSTNFNRANPKNTYPGGYPCWRYNKAVEMLDNIEDEENLTVDYFKAILDACHIESAVGNTLYSNVFDLKNGIIYLYHWHQFYETKVLKVADVIAQNTSPIRIKDLFSQETVKKAEDEYERYKDKKKTD